LALPDPAAAACLPAMTRRLREILPWIKSYRANDLTAIPKIGQGVQPKSSIVHSLRGSFAPGSVAPLSKWRQKRRRRNGASRRIKIR
jgi:hypothetical protein